MKPNSKHSTNSKKNITHKKIILQLNDVEKIYQLGEQTITALKKINFKLYQGDFVAIMGPSGSGKSTFLQVASMLAKPSSGQIILNGKNVSSYNEAQRARLRNSEIGFIFQQFNLLKKTSALDNVALPLLYAGIPEKQRRKQAKIYLEKVDLSDRLNNTPAQLSGGQQQRVAIARALVNNPSIIFADEPTGNLDSKSGVEVERLLTKLHQGGATIIMVTHDQHISKIAKRQIYIKDGVIISDKNQPSKIDL